MSLRQTLLELATRHQLDQQSTTELQTMAGLRGQPGWLPSRLPQAVALAGAALIGLGLVFWVASNWDGLGRFGRIGILQAALAVGLLAALFMPRLRTVAALFAFLSIGALFACIGQTYQTGADPWQLFALWTALGLPLCLVLRSEALWTPWLAVASMAIALWARAVGGWDHNNGSFTVVAAAWLLLLLLPAMMLPPLRRHTGSGAWSLRLAALLAMTYIALPASVLVFNQGLGPIMLAVLLVGAATAVFARHDLPATSIACLALLYLTVFAFAKLLDDMGLDNFTIFMASGALAIVLVSLAVTRLTAMHRAGGKA
jgi:uncharacterized membrane protein